MDRQSQLVADLPLLARLSPEDRRALASMGRLRTFGAGAVIFAQGDPGDSLHIVMDGSIRVTVLSPAGDEATLAKLGPGESCGELSLLDGQPRSASAVAAAGTTTLEINRQDFARWLAERPRAAVALLETVSLRVRQTDEALADLAFLDLPHRLAKRLLSLAGSAPPAARRPSAEAAVLLRVTQGELASMLGVSRESVNKELNGFAQRGWVVLGRGSVTVTRPAALQAFHLS